MEEYLLLSARPYGVTRLTIIESSAGIVTEVYSKGILQKIKSKLQQTLYHTHCFNCGKKVFLYVWYHRIRRKK